MTNCCPCCENILPLGCFSPCDVGIDVGYTVGLGEAGNWSVLLQFGRSWIRYTENFDEGDALVFSLGNLNENYAYTGQIKKPDGSVLVIEKDGIEYNCFEFVSKTVYQ
jgi:hypothetical protein